MVHEESTCRNIPDTNRDYYPRIALLIIMRVNKFDYLLPEELLPSTPEHATLDSKCY